MRIHGVRVDSAQKAKEAMGDELTPEKLIDMQIHGHFA
jgi:hypothetical protein